MVVEVGVHSNTQWWHHNNAQLLNLKAINGQTNKAFTKFLDLLKDICCVSADTVMPKSEIKSQ